MYDLLSPFPHKKACKPYLFDTTYRLFYCLNLLCLAQLDPPGPTLEPSPVTLYLNDRKDPDRAFPLGFTVAGSGAFPDIHRLRHADEEYVAEHSDELNQFTDLQHPNAWYYYIVVEATNAHEHSGIGANEKWGVPEDGEQEPGDYGTVTPAPNEPSPNDPSPKDPGPGPEERADPTRG